MTSKGLPFLFKTSHSLVRTKFNENMCGDCESTKIDSVQLNPLVNHPGKLKLMGSAAHVWHSSNNYTNAYHTCHSSFLKRNVQILKT